MTDNNKLRDAIIDMEASLSTNLSGYSMWHYGADIHGITRETLKNAIEALKAQEPRVMTLEEVKAAAEHDVWIELSGNFADDVLFAATIEGCGTKGLCTRYESHNYSAYGIKPYGWRCWTSRPTDEQKKAVKWE